MQVYLIQTNSMQTEEKKSKNRENNPKNNLHFYLDLLEMNAL